MQDLATGGLIMEPRWTLEVELPVQNTPIPIDMVDALQARQTWHALEQRFPGSISLAAQRMHAARARKASDAVVLTERQRVVETLLQRLLSDASPAAREKHVALLVEQLRATRTAGAGACRDVLSGDAAARRTLPGNLVLREAEWMVATAAEPVRRTREHGSTALDLELELEVIRRTLGDDAPARLAALRKGVRAGAGDCASAILLLDTVKRLPPSQRGLAARMLFHS